MAESAEAEHQYYEVRSYLMGKKSNPEAVDQFLQTALLPALGRAGVGPVGVFGNAPSDESDSQRIVVVIPYDSPNQIVEVKEQVQADPAYRKAAEAFQSGGNADAPYQRISSELLRSMKCWPKATVDKASLNNDERVYELRLYESANERLGNLKVDMFNNGEVPIFLECGIQPIFIGQGLIGPHTPSLTYLTRYPNDAARRKSWDAFRSNPNWAVLKDVEKYKGTVGKIYKYVLVPKPFSQM